MGVDKSLYKWKCMVFTEIAEEISPFQVVQMGGYEEELSTIIDQALALDKEISGQWSRIHWGMGRNHEAMVFDSNLMELEKGQTLTGTEQEVPLVIPLSPAVIKTGKSTGEGFDEQSVILRMEVTFENTLTEARR